VPYRDPQDRKRYDRERRERQRSGRLRLVAPARLQVAADVEALLGEAIGQVRADARARGTEKARTLGYLASIALRLIEARELEGRLQALEEVLAIRDSA